MQPSGQSHQKMDYNDLLRSDRQQEIRHDIDRAMRSINQHTREKNSLRIPSRKPVVPIKHIDHDLSIER